MVKTAMVTVALLAWAGGASVSAQGAFGVEVRGGAAFPTADLGDTPLKTGGGAEATALVRVLPHLHLYGGWSYFAFVTDGQFAGGKYDAESTGYSFGAQFRHPVRGGAGLWLRAGGLYEHIELEDDAGETGVDSGHDLGWEVGGGAMVPLGGRFTLTPGVRYRSLSTDLRVGTVDVPVDLRYITAEIGVTWTFGGSRPLATARR